MYRELRILVKWGKHSVRRALRGRLPDLTSLRRQWRTPRRPRETREERAARRRQERAEVRRVANAAQRAERRHLRRELRSDHTAHVVSGLVATDTPIVVGPWLGEVGFEVLYWIPFLRWVVEQGVSPDRILAISRGGPQSWYRGVAGEYRDIFDMMTPDEFRQRNTQRTGSESRQKQGRETSPFEDEVIRRAVEQTGLSGHVVLTPRTLYRAIRPYSNGRYPLESLAEFSRYAPIDPLAASAYDWLPERFIAVKFYWSPHLKLNRSSQRFIARAIAALQEIAPVVLLDTGVRADNHSELTAGQAKNVISIEEHLTPATNLEVQTQVLARALAYAGTYGGTSYVASACGIPTITLTTAPEKLPAPHVALGAHVAAMPGFGPISVFDIRETLVLDEILEHLMAQLARGAQPVL